MAQDVVRLLARALIGGAGRGNSIHVSMEAHVIRHRGGMPVGKEGCQGNVTDERPDGIVLRRGAADRWNKFVRGPVKGGGDGLRGGGVGGALPRRSWVNIRASYLMRGEVDWGVYEHRAVRNVLVALGHVAVRCERAQDSGCQVFVAFAIESGDLGWSCFHKNDGDSR